MKLHPVAVGLDLVQPPLAVWHLPIEEASAGSMKLGELALVPTAAGFLC
jgi:hypothetical protein